MCLRNPVNRNIDINSIPITILSTYLDFQNINIIYTQMRKAWTDQLKLGQYTLKNRFMLAAMTRMRCNAANGVPNDLLVKYYAQRAGAGVLLTEASSWSLRGCSIPGAGDIYTLEQAQGWRKVTSQVHKKGAKIYIQLFHAGRSSHQTLNSGHEVLAPSAVPIKYDKMYFLNGADYPTPKAMTLQDIELTKREFEESVKLAKYAEFDGVAFHSANGYLIDQFIRSGTNKRTDGYGGSVQKRCRFVLQLTDIALKHFQPYQVALKFSPIGRYNDMFDQNPLETFSYLLSKLDERKIGIVQLYQSALQEFGANAFDKYPLGKTQMQFVCKALRPYFKGLLYGNSVTPEIGLKMIQDGDCDGISFGRLYISNPDLDTRIVNGYPFTNPDHSTFYGLFVDEKQKGYIDYPEYQQEKLH